MLILVPWLPSVWFHFSYFCSYFTSKTEIKSFTTTLVNLFTNMMCAVCFLCIIQVVRWQYSINAQYSFSIKKYPKHCIYICLKMKRSPKFTITSMFCLRMFAVHVQPCDLLSLLGVLWHVLDHLEPNLVWMFFGVSCIELMWGFLIRRKNMAAVTKNRT